MRPANAGCVRRRFVVAARVGQKCRHRHRFFHKDTVEALRAPVAIGVGLALQRLHPKERRVLAIHMGRAVRGKRSH
jgi:hypothetical protein